MRVFILFFVFFVFQGGAAFAQYRERAPVPAQEECPQGRQIRAQKAYPSTMSDCDVLDADTAAENQRQHGPAPAPYLLKPPAVATSSTIPQPSFDCARAKAAAARLICADANLARLDGKLGTAFQKRKLQLSPPDQSKFVADELSWLRDRNVRCSLVGKNDLEIEALASSKSCLLSAIRERIAFLGGVEQLPNQDMAQPSQMAVSPGPSASGFPSQSVQEAQPPPKQERTFDQSKIAALLDKRAPQRPIATGSLVNPTPSLGAATANSPELSQNEIDALRSQLMGCWNPPVGVAEAKNLIVIVHFALNRDGSVSGEPTVVNHGSTSLFQIAAESATRAVRRCQPFRLPAAKYEAWRDVEVKFDPNDMFRG